MCGVEQVKYQIPGATGISLQLQMITLLGDAAAAGFTINLFNAQPIMSWPEPGCMALVMVLMKNTLMRIAVLSANCQSGVWSGAGKMRVQTVNGASSCTNKGTMIASCPTGTFVVSGSYALTAWGKNSNHNSPDAMYTDPDNNRFVIVAPNNNSTTCFRAIATCASLQ